MLTNSKFVISSVTHGDPWNNLRPSDDGLSHEPVICPSGGTVYLRVYSSLEQVLHMPSK